MWKIAICDDEEFFRNDLRGKIEILFAEQQIDIRIFEYESGEDLVENVDKGFHLIFLDIKMQGIDGIRAGELIRERDEDVAIFFLTSYERFARKAYSVQAFGYLLKPADMQELRQNLKRAIKQIRKKREKVSIELEDGVVVVLLKNINYLENDSKNRRVRVWTTEGCYESVKKFADWETTLRGYGFYSVNRGCLVNCLQIKFLCSEYALLFNEEKVYFAQRRYKEFKENMVRYIRMIS